MRTKNFKLFFPLFICIFFLYVNNVIIPPEGYSFISPNLFLSCFIFWILNKKNYLNDIQIFMLGTFADLLYGSPLASSSLIFLLTKYVLNLVVGKYHIKNLQINIAKGFIGITIYYILLYIFIILFYNIYYSLNYFFMGYFLTFFTYPIIYIFFNWIIHRKKSDEYENN